jgi:putative transposase
LSLITERNVTMSFQETRHMVEQNPNEVSEPTINEKPSQANATKKKAASPKKSDNVKAEAPTRKLRRYTPAERADLLATVASETANNKNTLKDTLRKLSLSEQTYYNWKNDARAKPKPAVNIRSKKATDAKPSSSKASLNKSPATRTSGASNELKVLVSLEAENQRLRKSLAEKLRKENAELRKRLGLA